MICGNTLVVLGPVNVSATLGFRMSFEVHTWYLLD